MLAAPTTVEPEPAVAEGGARRAHEPHGRVRSLFGCPQHWPHKASEAGKSRFETGGHDPARVHGDEPQAGPAVVQVPQTRQLDLRSLGSGVRLDPVVILRVRIERGDIETLGVHPARRHRHDAAITGRPELTHEAMGEQERGDDVDGSGQLEPVLGADVRAAEGAGVVDEDVKTGVAVRDSVRQVADLGETGEVSSLERDRPVLGPVAHLPHGRLAPRLSGGQR